MTMIESFVKERNEALFSLDRRKIEAYLVKYGEGEPQKPLICSFGQAFIRLSAELREHRMMYWRKPIPGFLVMGSLFRPNR